MKKIFSLVFVVLLSSAVYSQSEDYTKALVKMFEVSGSEETYKTVIGQMIDLFKGQYSQVPEEFWDEAKKEFQSTSMTSLAGKLAPIYHKYLTLEDLQELIKFYETPTGKKYAKHTAAITQESMMVGQEWGQEIGKQIMQKLQEKGY